MTAIRRIEDIGDQYRSRLGSVLTTLRFVDALPTMPWSLLALNATFYLDAYLPQATYCAVLSQALQAVVVEQAEWMHPSQGTAEARPVKGMSTESASRHQRYRQLFDLALQTEKPEHLLLTQHACEIAEVLPDMYLDDALHLGRLRLGNVSIPAVLGRSNAGFQTAPGFLAFRRQLLVHSFEPLDFVFILLQLHALRRAAELTDQAVAVEMATMLLEVDAAQLDVAGAPEPSSLALRAVELQHPLAVLAVEAALVELDFLSPALQPLLRAVVARAIERIA